MDFHSFIHWPTYTASWSIICFGHCSNTLVFSRLNFYQRPVKTSPSNWWSNIEEKIKTETETRRVLNDVHHEEPVDLWPSYLLLSLKRIKSMSHLIAVSFPLKTSEWNQSIHWCTNMPTFICPTTGDRGRDDSQALAPVWKQPSVEMFNSELFFPPPGLINTCPLDIKHCCVLLCTA